MTDVPNVATLPPTLPAGAQLLDAVVEWLARFVAHPHVHALHAHALWVAHTHLVNSFENTPRIAFLSPEPGSGKSRALEVTEPLVVDPVPLVNGSVSYVFRRLAVEEGQPRPTLLLDEVDAIFHSKAGESAEDLRGLLNSGHRRGGFVGRSVVRGKEVLTEEWPSFGPVALAGLGDLPDTLMTRSVVIRMRRRSPTEHVKPYRTRVYEAEGHRLRQALAEWAAEVADAVRDVWPDLPESITDRNADVWEPLIAVADAAGGHWPSVARTTALFMLDEQSRKPATLSIQLLADIRAVFGGHHAMTTNDLLDALCALETSPWGTLFKGNRIDSRYLARTLSKYEVPTNNTVRIGEIVAKGYAMHHLADAWLRYLPPLPAAAPPEDEPF
jgi:hypothetical protein